MIIPISWVLIKGTFFLLRPAGYWPRVVRGLLHLLFQSPLARPSEVGGGASHHGNPAQPRDSDGGQKRFLLLHSLQL